MESEITKLNLDQIRFWADMVQFTITAGIAIYVYLANRERVKAARIIDLEKDFNKRLDLLRKESNERFDSLKKDFNERLDIMKKAVDVVEKALDARIDKHGERLAVVEAACTQAPSHQDLGTVYDRIGNVAEKVDGLGGEMKATRRILDNIQQHLMKVGP